MLRPRSHTLSPKSIIAYAFIGTILLAACNAQRLNASDPLSLEQPNVSDDSPPIDATRAPILEPQPQTPTEPEIVRQSLSQGKEVTVDSNSASSGLFEHPETEQLSGPVLKPPIVNATSPIKAALLVPLSGPGARIGQALLDAAQLALFDKGNKYFVLLPKDTGGTSEGARLAIISAIEDGAQIILGPLFSHSVTAVSSIALEHGINVVAFSTDRNVASPGVFLIGIMPEQQIDRVITFAHSQGLTRLAALIPESDYGDAILGALRTTVSNLGLDLVQVEFYMPGSDDLEPILRLANYKKRQAALKSLRAQLHEQSDEKSERALRQLAGLDTFGELNYDAIVLPAGGDQLRKLAPLLAFYDIDPGKIRYLGTTLWEAPTLGAEPSLVGGWFAGPPLRESARFQKRFAAAYGHRPPRIASLAYDATALAAVLAKNSGGDYSSDALTIPTGFAGADGIFKFSTDGIAIRGLAVIEVQPHSFRVISPAPGTFEQRGF